MSGVKVVFLKRIVSGGQTGVDRAALDFAITHSVEHGGWCPQGRKAEDGVLDEKYKLEETPSDSYEERTEWNVLASDGTLILFQDELSGGTLLTEKFSKEHSKPVYKVDLSKDSYDPGLVSWIEENQVKILNIAGPRASKRPEIYDLARDFLISTLVVHH